MNRNALASVLLLCIALASVVVGVVHLIRRDRAALVEQFAADRKAQVDAAAREVADALDDAADDLRFAGELLSRPGSVTEHRRELLALLEVVGQYKAIVVLDSEGAQRFTIMDRRAGPAVVRGAVGTVLTEAGREALTRTPGDILTSPPVAAAPGGWYRVFATAYAPAEDGPGGALAVLVDTEPFFAPLKLISTEPEAKLLLIGAHGVPTPASDTTLMDWYKRLDAEAGSIPAFAELVGHMRAGERGAVRIPEGEAARLGLGAADAIAAYTPIRMRGGVHWAVATLATTEELRAHERGVILRVALGAILVTFFLVVFGAYVIVASRRAVALQESRRHADRLAHLHEKTQKILDNIPTGVLALSAAGRITAVNQALRERLPPTAVGASLPEAFPNAPAAVVDRLASLVEGACTSGRVLSLHGEPLPLFGAEGQYRVHAVPLEQLDAEVRVLLVVEDLSNVHALESQLLRAEKLATVGILAAGIAHEIGTPLGVVRGRAEYVLGKLGAQHAQAAGVQVIIEQIDRVSRTIRQLLDFSRVQPALVREVALGPLLRGAQELLHGEAERRKVKVELEVPEGLPALSADPDQLQQVVLNLALNACDACEPGGTVRLAAHVEAPGEPGALSGVRVTVRDDGCGIPPESLNRVFDPFFTTKKRGQGTGLGLTMVAQIVRNHGGRIELESEPGQGTCVTLWWPATLAPSEERHAV
ncbi:nitrogen regulation protein NR(II) [Vitiosangium sp. GDMCC 1.1324]|uniref:two-component system sensor histidine kinase NtrB n=1 Tax=Vitiosangium sp. (strain GDMCC 1.1324) TaxID=2138576 RepID=UPI000D3BCE7F|nr:ATP-binding protein [Vitiosangium sp. GDMCC 1.1324]PTL84944.1 histidine kinase [Vitiosangium sp. GDMCC 1.1324]